MPRGDRTGPWGQGPMTGRAAGYCAGYSVPGYMNLVPGFGRGQRRDRGRGFGRGWCKGFGKGHGRDWWAFPPQYQQPYPPYQQPYPTYQTTTMYQGMLPGNKICLFCGNSLREDQNICPKCMQHAR